MYDVTTQHLVEPADDYIESAAKQVLQIHCSEGAEGDILVFLPGKYDDPTCADQKGPRRSKRAQRSSAEPAKICQRMPCRWVPMIAYQQSG